MTLSDSKSRLVPTATLPMKNFTVVKFMLEAGAYSWHPLSRHTCCSCYVCACMNISSVILAGWLQQIQQRFHGAISLCHVLLYSQFCRLVSTASGYMNYSKYELLILFSDTSTDQRMQNRVSPCPRYSSRMSDNGVPEFFSMGVWYSRV